MFPKKNAYKEKCTQEEKDDQRMAKSSYLGGKISIENRLLENALVFFENTKHW